MGRQVAFRMLPEDLDAFEEALREQRTVFIAYYHRSPEIAVCSTLDHRENSDSMHIPQQGYWLVDQFRSPVVELSRGGPFDGTQAPKGRLYFQTTYLDDDAQTLNPFPPEFVDWAQGVLTWVRRRFVRDPETGEYWGPHAREWRAAGSSS